MRILHIFDHSIPLHSGYTFRSQEILNHQRALGWETAHVTSPKHEKPSPPVETVDGLTFYRTPPIGALAGRWPVLRELAQIRATAARIEQAAAETRPDILHAHSPVLNGLAALLAARRLKLPVVYEIRAFWEDAAASHGTCREGDPRYRATAALETFMARNADAVTVICEGLRGDLIRRGIDAGKITIIPNAVDVANFSLSTGKPADLEAQLGLTGKTVLGFLGSFYDYEGLDILLDALPLIAARRPDIHLLMAGGGPQDEALRRQTARLGLQDRVLFTGRVPHSEVNRYYDLVDILVYPRKSMRLTELVTPLKPLEAMAQGKIFMASDVGGHRELVRDGETGDLFAPDSPQALADAVMSLLARRETWPDRIATARRFVEDERSWARSVDNYKKVYPRLLGKTG